MKVIKGDLIALARQGQFDVIIHGANCYNTMGGGIARTIRDTWPEAYQADCATRKGDYKKLGTFTLAEVPNDVGGKLFVINAYTQFRYWKDKHDDPNEPLVDYDALRKVFQAIKSHTFSSKPAPNGFPIRKTKVRFGIPKIGAGLALGDWDTIQKIIDQEMDGEDVTLVEWEA